MRAAKVDANQSDIVDALRRLGYRVAHTHTVGGGFPDIIVSGHHRGQLQSAMFLVEVKTEAGKLKPGQAQFKADWEPFVIEARKVSDVLRAFGWTELELEWVD